MPNTALYTVVFPVWIFWDVAIGQGISLEQSGARRRRQKGKKGERWHGTLLLLI